MVGYGLLVLALIRKMQEEFPEVTSPWYADDAMATGKLGDVMRYFKRLEVVGKPYGYYPEETKSILVVPKKDTEAVNAFKRESEAAVVISSGHRYLGGFVGDKDLERAWVVDQVEECKDAITALGEAAKFVPQAAFSSMQRSLQQEWTYVMRVAPLIGELFHPVEQAIHHNFFRPLLGSDISDTLRAWTTTLMKLGGFSVPNPLLAADVNYRTSQCNA